MGRKMSLASQSHPDFRIKAKANGLTLSEAVQKIRQIGLTSMQEEEVLRVLHDMQTEHQSALLHFARKLEIDPATGLLSRNTFLNAMKRYFSRERRHGWHMVAFSDLRKFKAVNDIFGHAAGDAVIAAVGGILKGHVRRSDGDIHCRYAGDEFVTFFPRVGDPDSARDYIDRFRHYVKIQSFAEWPELGVEIDCGVVCLWLEVAYAQGLEKELVSKLVKESDEAMYRAKSTDKTVILLRGFNRLTGELTPVEGFSPSERLPPGNVVNM